MIIILHDPSGRDHRHNLPLSVCVSVCLTHPEVEVQGSAGEKAAAQRDEDGGVSGPHGSVEAPGPEPTDHHEGEGQSGWRPAERRREIRTTEREKERERM